MKKIAYSYLRFSTPRQAKGDSYRRQMEAARKYAEEKDLSLQEDAFNDFGISAFKGRNVQNGALGDFLTLVQDGQIPKGAYLLVENHDRLSRTEPEEALHQLQSLVRAGIVVVTLHDGEMYKRGEMDVMRLMKSIIYMERAHNESMIKSQRGKSIWEKRRQDSLQTGKVCRASRLPSWLKWEGEQVVIDEDKAEAVRLMFKWCAGGAGYQTIARRLNDTRVPTFRTGVEWRAAVIAAILKNRAAIGEFQYHQKNSEDKRIPIGEPINNYYPSIVSVSSFQAVQSTIRKRDNHSGQFSKGRAHNLFTSLIKCGNCGSPMTVATKGRKTHGSPASTHFVCTRASSGGGECLNLQWDSSVIERHFKQAFPLFMDHYTRGDTDLDLTRKVNEHVSELQRDIELKQEALEYIVSAIEQGQGVQVFVSRAAALEAEIIGIREQIEDVRTQALPKTEDRAVRLERVIKLEKVLSTLDMGDVRTIAAKRLDFNAELRNIFSSIHLFWCYSHAQGVMVFVDHYGQEVLELQFQEGLEHGVALTLVEKVHDELELGCTVSDEPELLFEFEPRHKELKTYVERSQQARGAAKRRLKEKTERAEELTRLGLLEGVIAGYMNE